MKVGDTVLYTGTNCVTGKLIIITRETPKQWISGMWSEDGITLIETKFRKSDLKLVGCTDWSWGAIE